MTWKTVETSFESTRQCHQEILCASYHREPTSTIQTDFAYSTELRRKGRRREIWQAIGRGLDPPKWDVQESLSTTLKWHIKNFDIIPPVETLAILTVVPTKKNPETDVLAQYSQSFANHSSLRLSLIHHRNSDGSVEAKLSLCNRPIASFNVAL